MKAPRWTVVSPSAYEWEREALEFLREHLPDRDPWRAWSNFEFVDDDGRVNEVDLLVLSPAGLLLVEIKSRPGTIDGDAHSWVWMTDGRRHNVDNPLLLANRKAKRLASLLKRQDAFGRGANRVPWVTEVIFLSKVLQPPAYRSWHRAQSFPEGQSCRQPSHRHYRGADGHVGYGAWAAGICGLEYRACYRKGY